MPFKRPLEALGEEIHFDSGDYHALLDTTLDHVEWIKLNRELAARREKGEMVGVGLAMFVEKAGLGPADGPGWGRVLAHLGVGVVGELVVRLRGGWPMATRIGADAAVTVAVLVLIWWAWLP
jgi:CO/xanthine dehydrogenase Mo-binding subunit